MNDAMITSANCALAKRTRTKIVTDGRRGRYVAALAWCIVLFFSGKAGAQEEPGSEPRTTEQTEEEAPEQDAPPEMPSPYRNAQGTIQLAPVIAIGIGNNKTVFGFLFLAGVLFTWLRWRRSLA